MLKRNRAYVVALLLSPMLLAAGCTTIVRDALLGGAFDFVAGSTTDLLTLLFPVADALAGG